MQLKVSGVVLDPTNAPVGNVSVLATRADVLFAPDYVSGYNITDASPDFEWYGETDTAGQFSLAIPDPARAPDELISRALGGRAQAEYIFRVYDRAPAGWVLLGSQRVFLSDASLRGLNKITVTVDPNYTQVSGGASYAVSGFLGDSNGSFSGAWTIGLYRQHLRGSTLIGTATTTDGRFLIRYYGAPGELAENPSFAIFLDAGNATSRVICHPTRDQTVRLVFGNEEYRGPSQFELESEALAPFLDSATFASLTLDEVEALMCRARLEGPVIARLARAHALASVTTLSAAAYYAFAHAGYPLSLTSLANLRDTEIDAAIHTAVAANIVPAALADDLTAIRASLHAARLDRLVPSSSPGSTSLGAILVAASLGSGVPRAFAEAIVAHTGTPEQFWDALRKNTLFGDAVVDRIQFTLQIGVLTANYPPLVQFLHEKREAGEFTHAFELARYEASDWADFMLMPVGTLSAVGTPAGVFGESPDRRRNNYSEAIARMVEDQFPTAHLIYRLPAGSVTADLEGFLRQNPTFSLLRADVEKFLLTAAGSPNDPEALKRDLLKVQRVTAIAPRFGRTAVARGLLSADITSARRIQAMGYPPFKAKMASAGLSTHTDAVYINADRVATTALHMFLQLRREIQTPTTHADTTPRSADVDLKKLFGNQDYCACKHCESVYGPAAYFVDLMRFLEEREIGPGVTQLTKLLLRRPELDDIKLNCENSDTPLPTIDLVNETLERRARQYLALGKAASDQQTTWSVADLAAHPEHIDTAVYIKLAQPTVAHFPLSLPFDLSLAEARGYLDLLGFTRVELQDALEGWSGFGEDEVYRVDERLGFSSGQGKIARAIDPPTTRSLWGYTSDSWLNDINLVESFLDRAQLDLTGLQTLLRGRFVTAAVIKFAENCSLAGARLVKASNLNDDAFDEPKLRRLQTLLRTQRALGWSFPELDATLATFGLSLAPASVTADLAALARFVRVRQQFPHLPLGELLSWWGPIDTHVYAEGGESFYDQVVRPRSREPEFLALNGSEPFNSVRSSLQAILQVDLAGLYATYTATALYNGSDLDLANLSKIYRVASLARAIELSVPEMVSLRKFKQVLDDSLILFSGNPDAPIRLLIDVATDVRDSGFTVPELDWILCNVNAEKFGASNADITRALVGLITSLQQADVDHAQALPLAELPQAERVAKLLIAVLPTSAIPAAVSFVLELSAPPANADAANDLRDTHLPFIAEGDVGYAEFGSLFAATTPEGRVTLLEEWFRQKRRERVVIQQLATPLGLEPADVEVLLRNYVKNAVTALTSLTSDLFSAPSSFNVEVDAPKLKEETFPKLFLARTQIALRAILYRNLRKAALVAKIFRFSPGLLRWVLQHAPDEAGILDLANLPLNSQGDIYAAYEGWDWLRRLIVIRDRLKDPDALLEILDLIYAAAQPFEKDDVLEALAPAAGWDVVTLKALEAGHPVTQNDLKTLAPLEAFHQAFRAGARLGVHPDVALAWANPLTVDAAYAAAVKGAVQSRFSPATWTSLAQPVRDRLRERQRDALADLLVRRLDLQDREDLFGELLMDVDISCCGRTTRLLFATAAVQLFVQRALMGLETDAGVVLSDDDEDHWSAMKRYRVWEADRKIFLYPENWLTPELRDDKTPLFKRLEDEIAQSEADTTSVEKAYINYLEGLQEIARLTIIGMYQEAEGNLVHVFGRTAGEPSTVYYRRRVNNAYWTPWEPLPFPVDATDVLPVVAFRRLMLIWPKITVHSKEPPESATSQTGPRTKSVDRQLRLMWAEYRDGHWGSVRTTEASVFIRSGVTDPDTSLEGRHPNWDVALSSRQKPPPESTLEIRPVISIVSLKKENPLKGHAETNKVYHEHSFRYAPDTGSFEAVNGAAIYDDEGSLGFDYPKPAFSVNWHQGFGLLDGMTNGMAVSLPLVDKPTVTHYKVIFAASGYEVMYPRQEHRVKTTRPLTFSDSKRVFYLRLFGKGTDVSASSSNAAEVNYGGLLPYFSFTNAKFSAGQVADLNPLDSVFSGGENGATKQESIPTESGKPTYGLSLLYHPYARLFLQQVRRFGVPGLLDPAVASKGANTALAFQSISAPLPSHYFPHDGIDVEYLALPKEEIDFLYGGAYSVYNWELFFHIPMYIADRLMAERRFAEAQRWLGYVFNPNRAPIAVDPEGEHYWRIKPFQEAAATLSIDRLLELLQDDGKTPANALKKQEVLDQIDAWRDQPFSPHVIARLRPTAYMRAVVMKYLDNLIAWGDDLFREDTRESTQEAVQLYILALQILDKRPRRIDGDVHEDKTYAEAKNIDSFSNFLVNIENKVLAYIPMEGWDPLDKLGQLNYQAAHPDTYQLVAVVPDDPETALLDTIKPKLPPSKAPFNPIPEGLDTSAATQVASQGLYFCIPPNDKLLGYWDTVADRLFKLRNCLNIEGIRRDLALFDPPIDPALLAKAAAQGIDIATAISNLHAPLPHYRFLVHLGIAKEFASQVSGLGSALLSALEKRDAEVLAVLRAGHERTLLDFTRKVREQSLKEAEDNLEALRLGRAVIEKRRDYYKSRERMNKLEKAELGLTIASSVIDVVGSALTLGSSAAAIVPDFNAGISGFAASPVATVKIGGSQVSNAMSKAGSALGIIAGVTRTAAGIVGTQASYTRRKEEWDFQQKLAETELPQLDKQITAAEIRVEMARLELVNHDEQVRQSSEALEVMQSKFSNAELYAWMSGELSKVYNNAYQLAVDMARRTERCYQYELAVDSDFVQFGHWDNRRQGLLAGERLGYDLRRMEAAYYENNRREYELTKRVSLAGLDPVALISLRKTGACHFQLPSVIFNLDHASHFQRRIKLVGVSIPAVTGPYTNIGVNLTFESGKIRTEAAGLPQADNGTAQAQAISVSQEDTGLFEPNLRDERYLPFEGRGLEDSMWRLELPAVLRQFDYETISDVILTIRYTAREGGTTFAVPVLNSLKGSLEALPRADFSLHPEHGSGQVRIFSARAEFPEAWRTFVAAGSSGVAATLALDLSEQRFPHPQLPPGTRKVDKVVLFVRWPAGDQVPGILKFAGASLTTPGNAIGACTFGLFRDGDPAVGPRFNYVWLATADLTPGQDLGAWSFNVPGGWGGDVDPEDLFIVVQHKVS